MRFSRLESLESQSHTSPKLNYSHSIHCNNKRISITCTKIWWMLRAGNRGFFRGLWTWTDRRRDKISKCGSCRFYEMNKSRRGCLALSLSSFIVEISKFRGSRRVEEKIKQHKKSFQLSRDWFCVFIHLWWIAGFYYHLAKTICECIHIVASLIFRLFFLRMGGS